MVYSITKVKAREVLDSRGNPTVEVEVHSDRAVGAPLRLRVQAQERMKQSSSVTATKNDSAEKAYRKQSQT